MQPPSLRVHVSAVFAPASMIPFRASRLAVAGSQGASRLLCTSGGGRDPSSCSGIYDSILQTIGRTPVVRSRRLLPEAAQRRGVQLYLKLEYFNPLGSVKDRLALAMIEAGERSGALSPGQTVVDATSGNTGIGLAFVCAVKGYPFVSVMAELYSEERRKIMRALGAKVIITPAAASGTGMLAKAKELAATHKWYLARQFENEANAPYHSQTTAAEILRDFAGHRIDYFVTGYGTGGTFTGVSRVLRVARPEVKIILAEPVSAPLVKSKIAQKRFPDGSPSQAHPEFKRHIVQGWVPNFIPKVAEEGVEEGFVAQSITVTDDAAASTAQALARKEGVFAGISAGATVAAALQAANTAPDNAAILAMVPDTQERYLSSPNLYPANTGPQGMTEEELLLSRSTPSYQME